MREQIAAVSAYERLVIEVERELAALAAIDKAFTIPAVRDAVAHYDSEMRKAVASFNAHADALALWTDWCAVGDDLRAAINDYETFGKNAPGVPAETSNDQS